MKKFISQHIILPFKGKWIRGMLLLLLWTVAFVALPAISGWFLAMCSVVFITANTAFSYLVPSAIIRLLAVGRTVTRYFERLQNHTTTLSAQQSLQLKIFRSVARMPYFKKQVNNNSVLLENSTQGVDQILNHILLWLLPFVALFLTSLMYALFVGVFSLPIAVEFLFSSAILLFVVPQLFFRRSEILYGRLKSQREENNQSLIESFRGRIEIAKYNLQEKAVKQYNHRMQQLEKTERRLHMNSLYLQLAGGLGFSFLAVLVLWHSHSFQINAQTAIGIFFGIMAQAELAEILFSGKSERSSVVQQVKDIDSILTKDESTNLGTHSVSPFNKIVVEGFGAKIPETSVKMPLVSLEIQAGEWIALYGETGKGKTTFLNGLFYPEYRNLGKLIWDNAEIPFLPVPECVYVTQKAYLLTGTLRENFQGYSDEEIKNVLHLVDLSDWCASLPDDLNTWIGENGETLSGGQRKKMLLAQALLNNPRLLVVDEPTAGISADNAIEIFQTIRKQFPDMSILMATHLRDFEKVANKVVKL